MFLRKLSFSLLIGMMALLVGATIYEKGHGSDAVARCIYGSTWFALCWVAVAGVALLYVCRRRLFRRPVPFLIHVALILILVGAGITHLWGRQGTIALRCSESAARFTDATDAERIYDFPFSVRLEAFELRTYPGTATPMDYVSRLTFSDRSDTVTISMNHIATHHGYRFYQSGYDPDLGGVLLSVSHDPWGIAVTYVGYALLFLSMLCALLLPDEGFRRLLRALRRSQALRTLLIVVLLLPTVKGLASATPAPQSETATTIRKAPATLPHHLSRSEAEAFGHLYVLWNGRICPLQSVARDFTIKLCGRDSYRGLTAEQVFTGWYFYPSSWSHEPMLRIRSAAAREVLGVSGRYAAWDDFIDLTHGPKLETALAPLRTPAAPLSASDQSRKKALETADELYNLIAMHLNGQLLRIYPCHTDSLHPDAIAWYTAADRLPETLSPEQWMFVRRSLDYVGELVHTGATDDLLHTLDKIRQYQQQTAGAALPSERRIQAEMNYNRLQWTRPVAMTCLTVGLLSFLLLLLGRARHPAFRPTLTVGLLLVGLYQAVVLSLRGYVSGHLPMANGYETMQLMALCSVLLTLLTARRSPWMLAFGWMLTGLTLLVSMLGQSNPAITPLVPVLASPLLCLHVVIVMLAYTLLAFIMMLGVAGLLTSDPTGRFYLFSRTLLYPALFLLAAGIFIGAIWANVSWGRYWGWDPKEVWALITLLLYSLAFHTESLPAFRRPRFYHGFMILSFLAVLMTYFGVNFLLGGMHSYAAQ
jgi:ABC-type transport system involved in cytochrome c biogenesis permease subunit